MSDQAHPSVTLVSAANQQATGVDRYASNLEGELKKAGARVASRVLVRRELHVGPVRAGGLASLWWQRARSRPATTDLVHALDPVAAAPGMDVVTVHDLIPETLPDMSGGGFAAQFDWALSRRNARSAKHIIAISQCTRHQVVERWGVDPERVHVVHQGIDLERFHPTKRADAERECAPPIVLYVGDDNPRKNLPLTIRALGSLRATQGISLRFVRVGPTRFPDLHAQLVREARALGVEFVEPGYLDDEALVRLMGQARVFLWPTLAEGFGFPPLEAMACGTPVVALDTPINREICGSLARYHSDEPGAAAEAIAAVIAAPPAAEALRAHAASYTWEETAQKTLRVYERVLSER